MLELAAGLTANAAVSASNGAPKPTLSTTVVPASEYKMTVLSGVTEEEVEYSRSAEVDPS